MTYKFKRFSGFNTRSSKPTVSITRAEAIGLSSSFCERYEVDKFRYAVLYYDEKSNSIGFRLTNDENEKSKFSITRTNKNKGKSSSIVSHTFFTKNEIVVDKYAHKYMPKKVRLEDLGFDEPGDLFVFDLEEEQPELD
ncbi:hypothetical protein HYW35_02105 [Candidatus Saccharibacteria bacterium]|nr:hypothetical protein [Candidatus Saccharibacteria bacterium]